MSEILEVTKKLTLDRGFCILIKVSLETRVLENLVKILLYSQFSETMTPTQYQLTLNFEQVLTLVKQLPEPEKLQLSQELARELLDSKLTALLEGFKTDELSLDTITQEVEAVRSEIYAKKSAG